MNIDDFFINSNGEKPSDEIIKQGFPNVRYALSSDELNFFYKAIFSSLRDNWGTHKNRLKIDEDLNNLLEAGSYVTALITSDDCNKELPHKYEMKNYPSKIGGFVIVSRHRDFTTNDIILQKVIDYTGTEYNRVKANAQWSNWVSMATHINLESYLKVNDKAKDSEKLNGKTLSDIIDEYKKYVNENYLKINGKAKDSEKLNGKTFGEIKSEIQGNIKKRKIYRFDNEGKVILPKDCIDMEEVVVIHRGGKFKISIYTEDKEDMLMGARTPMSISVMSYTKFYYDKLDKNWLVFRGEIK